MFRSTIALALTAAASAQVELTTEVVDGAEHLIARGRRNVDLMAFEERINAAMATAQLNAASAAFNATQTASFELASQINSIRDAQTAAQASTIANAASQQAAMAALTQSVNSQMSALTQSVNSQMSAMNAVVSTQLASASTATAAGLAEGSAAVAAGVSTAVAAVSQATANIANCSARGQFLNAQGQCTAFSPTLVRNTATTCNVAGHLKVHPTSGKIEVCDGQRYKASLPTVTHRGYTSSQGCENCYPGHRDIVFRKHYADTYLRVMWYDNTRMYGWHGRRGAWHVRVCDANGNGCADCNDPGKMMSDKYTWAEHGWRTNLHHPQQVTALCRRTTNRQLNPGQYKIRLWLASGHDAYTGHHSQYGSLQVEEVYKA